MVADAPLEGKIETLLSGVAIWRFLSKNLESLCVFLNKLSVIFLKSKLSVIFLKGNLSVIFLINVILINLAWCCRYRNIQ